MAIIMLLISFSLFVTSSLTLVNSGLKTEIKTLNYFESDSEINLDFYNRVFLLVVMTISVPVLLPSGSHMFGVVSNHLGVSPALFVGSTGTPITFDNFYWSTVGRDGLGVAPPCLTTFYMNTVSINNGISTLLQNRFGDPSPSVPLFSLIDFSMNLKSFLPLLIGCAAKSAQFPFNSRLLAAMSAPTPISSLAHPPTLAVAGAHTTLKFSVSLVDMSTLLTPSVASVIHSLPGSTGEVDTKKLIAHSTMNHVSMMMFFLGVGSYKIVSLHPNAHALSKPSTFMSSGHVMMSPLHGQDNRLVSISSLAPFVKIIFPLSSMALAGLPFPGVFLSKDLVIESPSGRMNSLPALITIVNSGPSLFYVIKTTLLKLSFSLNSVTFSIGSVSVPMGLSSFLFLVNISVSSSIMFNYEVSNPKLPAYLAIIVVLIPCSVKMNSFMYSYDKLDFKTNRPGVSVPDTPPTAMMRKEPSKNSVLVNWRVPVSPSMPPC